jgi:hypothetical protein
VRRINDLERKAGMHRTYWDLRHFGPMSREQEENGASAGTLVMPGEYKVRLKAIDTVEEIPLTVKLGPSIQVSEADLKQRESVALGLRDAISAVNLSLRHLDALKEQVAQKKKLASPMAEKDKKAAEEFLKSAEAEIDKQIEKLSWRDGGYRLEDRPGLVQNLQGARYVVSNTILAPLPHQMVYARELAEEARARVLEINQFYVQGVRNWNTKLGELKLGTLAEPPPADLPPTDFALGR